MGPFEVITASSDVGEDEEGLDEEGLDEDGQLDDGEGEETCKRRE